jgi:putative membrane protein
MYLILNWFLSAAALMVAAYLIPQGVTLTGFFPALVAAVVLGLVNAIIRPLLLVLTLPINIFTLGLFTLVINAFMVQITSALVKGFDVHGFWWAMLFSVILFLVNSILHSFRQIRA